ncbi:hypothetical protein ACFQLX_03855 [Streptomyces polyrhachis]|uniref:Uncharacterized protein n=1 Tax=Streptomyces polyrhachis TaxID=1282885 RepID=A0ABW2GCL7_9ACTN
MGEDIRDAVVVGGPHGVAIRVEGVPQALARSRRAVGRWWSAIGATMGVGLALGVVAGATGSNPLAVAAGVLFLVALLLLVPFGIAARVIGGRVEHALHAGPWLACAAVPNAGSCAGLLVLRDPYDGMLRVLSMYALRWNAERIAEIAAGGTVWWRPHPRRPGGVVAAPGGAPFVWAGPSRMRGQRRQVLRVAEQAGLTGCPGPAGVDRREELRSLPSFPDTLRARTPLDYAALAAAAESRSAASPPASPGRALRTAPWWRTPMLWQAVTVGILLAVVGAALGGLISAIASFAGFGFDVRSVFMGMCFGLGPFGAALIRFPGEVAAARRFSRAAQAPAGPAYRYVLLHGPGTYLVLYDLHGAPDDEPVAILPLNIAGTSAPTGTVELRGWLDHDHEGDPFVVPFIENRPCWPRTPLRQSHSPHFAGLRERVRGLSRDGGCSD